MRAENLSRVHKSRLAHVVKQCIMCGANELTNRMTDAIRSAFKKHPSLINYEYRKCLPTFRGMPKVFDDTGGILYGQQVAESALTAPQVGCDAAQAVLPHLCI